VGPPHSQGFYITHNDAPQAVGLLWTSDQLVAETSTCKGLLNVNLTQFNSCKWPTWRTITLFYNTFIANLYMFRTTSCSSSGGQIVL